jgi:hypothetical protein
MVDLIENKKRGGVLSAQELRWFVAGYVSGEIPDYQAAALCMAIWFRGMNAVETAALTLAMADSGDRVDLSGALARADRLVALAAAVRSLPDGAFNRCARQVSRTLIPVGYTEAGPFGHDPAINGPAIPALKRIGELAVTAPGSDAERFLRPLVTRGINRVIFALEQAVAALTAELS